MLYALALVPVGLLADRTDRPRLLAGGIALWSILTMAASETRSFGQASGGWMEHAWLRLHAGRALVLQQAPQASMSLPTCSTQPTPAPSCLQLLAMRVGFAAAQATQNPICFSLIPELFPKNRTTAMAVYNTAIYAGRALSFAALILAGQLGVPQVLPG